MSGTLSRPHRGITKIVPVFLLAATLSCAVAGDPPKGPPSKPSLAAGLDHLLKLTPAERMRLLAKVVDKDKDFATATRGALTETIVERGSVEAVQSSDVICRVRAVPKGSGNAAIIKWLIHDGSPVKKGDKVFELFSPAHADVLRKQKEIVAEAEAEQKRAADALDRTKNQNRIDVKLAEIDLRLAELAVRQDKGNDVLQKENLALHVARAALLLERVKLQGPPKLKKANDILKAKKSVRDEEQDRLADIEKEIADCVMTAPRDGMVVYYVPEGVRSGSSPWPRIIAQGEPAREGQRLLSIANLAKMAVRTRIHEDLIGKIRAGQEVKVLVDAFPGRTYAGKVTLAATVANQYHFGDSDVKRYQVAITLDGENKDGLRPGMSADITIVIGEQTNCLRLAASAVLGKGKETFCYALTGKKLHVRKVTVGVTDGKLVEITNGLKEGERVLRNPSAAVARVIDSLRLGDK